MSEHGVMISEDEDMWSITVCSCGWRSPACPDDETAVDVWGGHLVDAVLGREESDADRLRAALVEVAAIADRSIAWTTYSRKLVLDICATALAPKDGAR